jgi:hypothetical protein
MTKETKIKWMKTGLAILLAVSIFGFLGSCAHQADAYSGSGGVWAYRYAGYIQVNYPGTQTGIQQALDYVAAGNGGIVTLGPGTYTTTQALYIHSNTHLQGQGIGTTIIKRSSWNTSLTVFNTGNLIQSTAYGKNGIPNSNFISELPADSLTNITISSLTLDGNYSAFPTVDPNSLGNYGIRIYYTDKVNIKSVEVKNTLQTGIEVNGCRNVVMDDIWTDDTGKQINLGTRNAINFNDNTNTMTAKIARWGEGATITNFHLTNFKDTGIDCSNVSDVNISNGYMYCDHDTIQGNDAFEWEGHIVGYTMRGFNISNVQVRGITNWFFTNGTSNGVNLSDVNIDNCSVIFSPTRHTGGAVNIRSSPGNNNILTNFTLSNSVFSNINTIGNANSNGMVYCRNDASSIATGIRVINCTFEGPSSLGYSATNPGFNLGGNLYDVHIEKVTIKNAQGAGFNIRATDPYIAREITLQDCFVDGDQDIAYYADLGNSSGKINGLKLINCIAKDADKAGGNYSFQFYSGTATSSIKNLLVQGCKIIRTSGTNMQGLRLLQSGSGVIDSVKIFNNDFTGSNSPNYTLSGTVTNLFTSDPMNTIANTVEVSDSLRANLGIYVGGQFIPKILRGSATLDFDLSAVTCQDLTFTLAGTSVGDDVILGIPDTAITTDITYYAFVSPAGTIKVRACDGALAGNPASATFSVTVIKR